MNALKNKTRYAVAQAAEIPPGGRKIVKLSAFGKEIEVGVFNIDGRLVAYRNACPHAGAPVCQGRICGTTLPSAVGDYILAREGEILRCPWHGWEFDLLSGAHLVDEATRLRAYEVAAAAPTQRDDSLETFAVETQNDTIWVLI